MTYPFMYAISFERAPTDIFVGISDCMHNIIDSLHSTKYITHHALANMPTDIKLLIITTMQILIT